MIRSEADTGYVYTMQARMTPCTQPSFQEIPGVSRPDEDASDSGSTEALTWELNFYLPTVLSLNGNACVHTLQRICLPLGGREGLIDARDVKVETVDGQEVVSYNSDSYNGENGHASFRVDEKTGQLLANDLRVLPEGVYGNGASPVPLCSSRA